MTCNRQPAFRNITRRALSEGKLDMLATQRIVNDAEPGPKSVTSKLVTLNQRMVAALPLPDYGAMEVTPKAAVALFRRGGSSKEARATSFRLSKEDAELRTYAQ